MKKTLLFLALAFCILNSAFSQNLVENPDFENYGIMPCGWTGSPVDFANSTNGWTSASQATPDMFSTLINPNCTNFLPHSTDPSSNGWQAPHSGDIFGGFYTFVTASQNYREYIQGHLLQPLVPGESYKVSMYVSLSDNSQFATDNMGIGFSIAQSSYAFITEIGTAPEINFTNLISDTATWTYLCDTIVATAAWNYFIIGNYFSDANTSQVNFNPGGFWDRTYYYCDDVSVEHIDLVPVAMFSADNHICPGTCTDFVNNSTGANSYVWMFPGANPSVSTDQNPTGICYNSPGTYPVTLIADNGTFSDTLTLNNFMTVYPYPPPQGIMQSGDTLFANQGATAYQWFYNGNIINGATDYFYVAAASGDYNVVATDNNQCEVEAVINDVVAGFNQLAIGNWQLAIYPNPVQDKFTIHPEKFGTQFTSETAGVEISIYNVMGEKVMASRVPSHEWQEWMVDCRQLSAGLYYLEINSAKINYRTKFIKQ
jgi:hypothetical protein